MNQSDKYTAIREIADAICAEMATEEQLQELQHLLKGNVEAKQFYYEYISLHNRLKSAADRNLDIVYRRMTEEIIVRPSSDTTNLLPSNVDVDGGSRRSANHVGLIASVALIVLTILVVIWFLDSHSPKAFSAKILQGDLSVLGKGQIDRNILYGGRYSVEQETILELQTGDLFYLSSGSNIKLYSDSEILLHAGKIDIEAKSGLNIIVNGSNFSIQTNGSDVSVDLSNRQPVVTTGKDTVLIAKRWRPKHYWSFNGNTDQVINSAGFAFGSPSRGATRTAGLVGDGAFAFDNSAGARIDVGSGGGTAPATGSFSAVDGISLEVLIKPEYSGHLNEIDEIFRKGHPGEDLRFMLSFHNDQGKDYVRPKIEAGASLSFGLYLVGQGYHELKLPLDGQDGRPTLAKMKQDDKAYHVVATYNVETGLKAIFVNGRQLASYQYPPGSKMLSGGPGKAMIGNNPKASLWQRYAYSGVIDELAFYDFALPSLMIENHFEQIKTGKNYFGLTPNLESLPENVKIYLPQNTSLLLNTMTGLPEQRMAVVSP